MAITEAADMALEIMRDRAHQMVMDISKLSLSKQERLGIAVVTAGAFIGGAAAILNKIAIDKGHQQMPMADVTKAVMDLIVEEMRKAH